MVRVEAAGICRSDVHYRSGSPKAPPLPRVLGHEIAGVVTSIHEAGADDDGARVAVGDRVGVHYQLSCGVCDWCARGGEQFCRTGAMIGNHRDGGYAEQVLVPVRALVPLPSEVSFEHGAVMMCSSATVYHALRRTRLAPGERVAVFGLGGLGASAVQLAFALGAAEVYAIDVNRAKTALAQRWGAIGVDASSVDPVETVLAGTEGVDVALELVGLRTTFEQAVAVLGPGGRAGIVGLAREPATVEPYRDIIAKEMAIIGVMDHLAGELPEVLELARTGQLDLDSIVTRTIPLDATAVDGALDELEAFGDAVRTVITPSTAW